MRVVYRAGDIGMENEFEYFARRAAEEREAAARAETPGAEQSHRALAERYALMADKLAQNPARSRVG